MCLQVKFRAVRRLLDDLVDWFETDVVYSDITKETLTVSVKVDEQAMSF